MRNGSGRSSFDTCLIAHTIQHHNKESLPMKYYIIYLFDGLVVDITTWDEEDARDQQYWADVDRVDGRNVSTYGFEYDEVQKLDQVR